MGLLALALGAGACGRSDGVSVARGDDGDTDSDTDDDGESTDDESGTSFGTTSFPTSFTTTFTTGSTFPTVTVTDTSDSFCGDGIVDPDEQCDPGDPFIGPGLECRAGCIWNVCGDGDPWEAEQCDDGNANNDDACRNDCTLGSCGDGVVDFGEECDDGDFDDTDECLSSCEQAACGDGFVWSGVEECDLGLGNGEGSDCTPACLDNVCGDGFQHAFDEQCDPGAGSIGPGMLCRDGCILNVCGDGDQWAGEVCDDGNMDNTDACASCQDAECGDGFVWAGMEDCDDQDANDLDRCHNDCSFHRVTQLALGGNHTCALFDSNLVKCWGNADDGRTGAGNETNIGDDEPAAAGAFIDIGADVTELATGISHSCAADVLGNLRCFGRASDGQLGYGNTIVIGDDEDPSAAGTVPLGSSPSIVSTRGGAFHNCALLASGEVKCWGLHSSFQLGIPGQLEQIGDDETVASAAAVDLGANPIALAVGNRHSCAIIEGGGVRCWGWGADGALGHGNAANIGDNEDPADIGNVPVGGTATQLTAGWWHTCAILDTGAVRCWGRGNNGRLGYGSTTSIGLISTPAVAGDVAVGGTVVEIAAGLGHTCARLDTGSVRCWGAGATGPLGYGNESDVGDNEDPADAGDVQLGATAVHIAADGSHTCAVTDTGAVRCWGNGGDGRLGYGNTASIGDDESPSAAGDVPLLPP